MPELPEVETVKLKLQKYLVGHRIEDILVKWPKIFEGEKKKVLNSRIKNVRRFGKVLSLDLENGYSLVVQIKLTGQLIYRGPKLKSIPKISRKVSGGLGGRHTHLIFKLDKTGILYYNDVRKFGKIKVVKTREVEKTGLVGKLGPEPFKDLNLKLFENILSGSSTKVKVLLMNQEKIAGVGNIYANDALWLSGIAPQRPTNSLSRIEIKKLYNALLKVLKKGIETGGASELAYVAPDGSEGEYQNHFLVYGKRGFLCKRCGREKIVKATLGGRGTYYCPRCQKI